MRFRLRAAVADARQATPSQSDAPSATADRPPARPVGPTRGFEAPAQTWD
jgi:hypothetical protein